MWDWRSRASCLGFDPDLWFPVDARDAVTAMKVCRSCEVRVKCGEAGVGERFGVWGGVFKGGR